VLATSHAATVVPASHSSTSWGYLIGVILLSAPTTIVAPDVMMGVGTLRSLPAARRTLAIVVVLLAGGGLLLAFLGTRATHLVSVGDADLALPRLMHVVLPSALETVGLLVLFGAALTGAVAEVMVCTFILDEQLTARRRARGLPAPTLPVVRLQMACVAAIAGLIALADTQVVGLVLTAFRVFVPGIVPQAVFALTGRRTRSGAVAASMIAGPLVSILIARIAPGLEETPGDPVLWGSLVAIGILAVGRIPAAAARLTEP
jgi:Na+/proline symporter